MTEVVASLTSKGQVTIPKAVRDTLGVGVRDRVVFNVGKDGAVTVRALRYPTVRSLAGAAGQLSTPHSGDLVAAAREERAQRRRK